MWLVAAVTASLAGALSLPTSPRWRAVGRAPSASHRASPAAGVVLVVGVGGALLGGLHGTRLALAAVVAAAGWAAVVLLRRERAARRAERRRQRVGDYCEALLGELRAGQPLVPAVERATSAWEATTEVAAAARLGADVPAAYRRLASRPGAGSLAWLAAAWELCAATGSGLAFALEQLLETQRAEQAAARAVAGELASARATARLVAALPFVVLVAAQGAGAEPWHFLLDTPPGLACLATGVGLAFAGLAWIDRIAAAAVDGPGS